MQECAVAIVGAGPTGMMLAAELALAGVDVQLLERRPNAELVGSRAGGLQSRAIELFDQRGVAERFLTEGTPAQVQAFGGVVLDISDFATRHPYGLALWQNRIEAILAEWVGELGVITKYGSEVVEVTPQDESVVVRLADGHPVRARYVVACDGGRSIVRKAAGISFSGWDATVSNLIAEVEYGDEPEWGLRQDAQGVHGITRLEAGRSRAGDSMRVVLTESTVQQGDDPGLDDLRTAMREIWGTDFGVHSPTWISRFTDAARQAATYRAGRILLAGDAAHVHYRPVARASASAYTTRSTSGGNSRKSSPAAHPTACSTPMSTNGTRSRPACCKTPWPRSPCAAPTRGRAPSPPR